VKWLVGMYDCLVIWVLFLLLFNVYEYSYFSVYYRGNVFEMGTRERTIDMHYAHE
jgi:hypothetical protein